MSNDGGPAFPMTQHFDQHDNEMPAGMSLRDYFAGQVLAGITLPGPFTDECAVTTANKAYRYADAMLAERGRDE